MDRRFLCTVLAVLAVTVGSAVLVERAGPPVDTPIYEDVSGVERPAEHPAPDREAEKPPEYAYIIREHEGRIAVFAAGNDEEPEMVYETLVKYLPDYDRQQLAEGVAVRDYRELISRIEDYIS